MVSTGGSSVDGVRDVDDDPDGVGDGRDDDIEDIGEVGDGVSRVIWMLIYLEQ